MDGRLHQFHRRYTGRHAIVCEHRSGGVAGAKIDRDVNAGVTESVAGRSNPWGRSPRPLLVNQALSNLELCTCTANPLGSNDLAVADK